LPQARRLLPRVVFRPLQLGPHVVHRGRQDDRRGARSPRR
jgi:hypothetical protein